MSPLGLASEQAVGIRERRLRESVGFSVQFSLSERPQLQEGRPCLPSSFSALCRAGCNAATTPRRPPLPAIDSEIVGRSVGVGSTQSLSVGG